MNSPIANRRRTLRWTDARPPVSQVPVFRLLVILGLGCLSITVLACSLARQAASNYPAADIETIYQGSQANRDRNPVILIHGLAGATLVRKSDGATAWGAFFTKDSMLPSSPNGLPAIALDIGELPRPLDQSDLVEILDDTEAIEMLETVHADAKIANISHKVYAALVEMVEQAGYGPCIDDTEDDPLTDGPECFTFFYDWRQDNVGNAIKFGQFLEEARREVLARRSELDDPPDRPVKFDLIAHSMGGLLTRYFLRYGPRDVLSETDPPVTWDGAEHLGRVIIISTPNFGAMKVLKEVITGQRFPVVKFEPAMLATWVSIYQLFPRQAHRLWMNEAGYPIDIEFASGKFWRDNKWGGFATGQDKYLQWVFPSTTNSVERQDLLESFMDAAFDRAARLARVLDKHPESDPPVPLILFTADAEPTLARAVVTKRKGTTRLKFGVKKPELKSPGDGSVTRASALADERLAGAPADRFTSPIPWSQKIFLTDKHLNLLGNATFQNNLLHILLETDSKQPPE